MTGQAKNPRKHPVRPLPGTADMDRYLIGEPSVVVPGWFAAQLEPAVLAWAKDHHKHGATAKLRTARPLIAAFQDAAARWRASVNGTTRATEADPVARSMLDSQQAAAQLGLSVRRVRQLATEGHIEAERCSGRWLFRLHAIENYRRERRAEDGQV